MRHFSVCFTLRVSMCARSHGATSLTWIWCMTSATILLVLHVKHRVRDNEYLREDTTCITSTCFTTSRSLFFDTTTWPTEFEDFFAWAIVEKVFLSTALIVSCVATAAFSKTPSLQWLLHSAASTGDGLSLNCGYRRVGHLQERE